MHRFGHHWMHGHGHLWGGGGFFLRPGVLLAALGLVFSLALLIGLVWAIVSLLVPMIRPMLKDIFGAKAIDISSLEILRRRYAAGEIDSDTFEQMWERLMASYQQEGSGMPRDVGYQEAVMNYPKDVSYWSL